MFKMELTDSDIELIETDTESEESGEDDDEPSCLNMVLPNPVRLLSQASYPIPVPASRDDPRRMKTEVRLLVVSNPSKNYFISQETVFQ
jgi:hypothetical protein